jgi:DNA helicase II / ATP-dependent DNA helicase PcrA
MPIEISDVDIEYAEKLLLPGGQKFDNERRAFIKCLESRDVVACPGSGKTTALLAKILILSKKMPFEDGRGICVLTHTNVAINEIKQRAGSAADSLFQYPNFFGTIQSFVHQFLTIPAYRSEFKKPIIAIDNDRFKVELFKYYRRDPGLRFWMEKRGGFDTLASYWLQSETLSVGKSLEEKIPNLSESTPTYQKIIGIRKELLEKGILSFNDAYSIALRYTSTIPGLSQSFKGRFCIIFLDEAQDTYEHQFRVLDRVFPSNFFIIQRIGDPNQAIFSSNIGGEMIWVPRNPHYISDSQRYGKTIVALLSSVRVHDEICLECCSTKTSYPVQILTFLPREEELVLKAFAELLHKFEIPEGLCCAIGWIGKDKDNGKLCIPTYFPQFCNKRQRSNTVFPNLITYSAYAIQNSKSHPVKLFFDIIFHGIVQGLDVAGIKNEENDRFHTQKTIKKYWKDLNENTYSEFCAKIAKAYLLSLESDLSPKDLRDTISASVKTVWSFTSSNGQLYLTENEIDSSINPQIIEPINQFISDYGSIIKVGTVHSVKGETHSATLYLETYYQKYTDSQRLIEFLKGNRPKKDLVKAYHIQNLLMAHVAFSRPKYLLVFACKASNISGHEDDLIKNGWEIHSVSNLLKK